MAGKMWLHAVVALSGIMVATAAPQAVAQTKDKIPVNPKLLVEPPEGAIVLFGGKAEEIRDNWYARRSTNPPAGPWTTRAWQRPTSATSAASRSSATATCTSSSASRSKAAAIAASAWRAGTRSRS